MAAAVAPTPRPTTATMIAIAIVLVVLYVGKDVFLPLALALLLAIAMLPVVARLQRIGLPRVPSVLVILLLVIGFAVGFVLILTNQLLSLVEALPTWEANLRAKLRSLSEGSGIFDQALRTIERLGAAMDAPAPGTVPGIVPNQVVLAPPPERPLAQLAGLAGTLGPVLAATLLVLLFMTYVLLQRDDLRERFIRLVGVNDVHRSTVALAEASQRIGRYLLMQLAMNLTFGVGMAVGLYFIGVPNAPLWGLLSFILRFVPYLGAPISVLFPLVVSLATDPGWTTPLLVIGWFAIVDGIVTYAMEPILYGHSVGVSPFALLLSSALWTVLWGPLGLVLAPAITACLVILGRYVPEVGWLEVALGSGRALPPALSAYQRLLSDDRAGAEDVVDAELTRAGISPTIHDVVLPLLGHLRDDRRRGSLPRDAMERIATDMEAITAELFEDGTAMEAPTVVCIGAGGTLDRVAARVIAADLRAQGHRATHADGFDQVAGAPAVVLSAMQTTTTLRLQRLAGRIRARLRPETTLVVGAWEQATEAMEPGGVRLEDGTRLVDRPAALLRALPPPMPVAEEVALPPANPAVAVSG